jgi:hypothetical protein
MSPLLLVHIELLAAGRNIWPQVPAALLQAAKLGCFALLLGCWWQLPVCHMHCERGSGMVLPLVSQVARLFLPGQCSLLLLGS